MARYIYGTFNATRGIVYPIVVQFPCRRKNAINMLFVCKDNPTQWHDSPA